jgi:hypothetical protein
MRPHHLTRPRSVIPQRGARHCHECRTKSDGFHGATARGCFDHAELELTAANGVADCGPRARRQGEDAIGKWLTSTIEMTDNGPRRRPQQLRSLTRCLPTAEDLRSPRAPRSLWCLARRTLREVADIAIGSISKRAQRVGFAGFGGNGPPCRGSA